jgi:hypothetical protein
MLKIAFLFIILVNISMGCNRRDDNFVPTSETTITTTTTTDCDREALEWLRFKRCTHPQPPTTTVYSPWNWWYLVNEK